MSWQEWLLSLPIDWMLFVSAFVSATLFPGGSEALLTASVLASPEAADWIRYTLIASAGNTLGSMSSWVIGRFLPERKTSNRALALFDRYGQWVLLFAWLPVIGDAFPLIAGWRRIPSAAYRNRQNSTLCLCCYACASGQRLALSEKRFKPILDTRWNSPIPHFWLFLF